MNNPNQEPNQNQGVNIVTGPAAIPGATFNTPPEPAQAPPVNNTPPTGGVTLGQVVGEPINPAPVTPMPTPGPTMSEALNPQPMTPPAGVTPPMPEQAPMPTEVPTPEAAPVAETPAPTGEAPKKKSIIPLVALVMVLLLIGGFVLYYFVLDDPRTIFTKAADTLFDKVSDGINNEKGTVDYSLGLSMTSEDESTQAILDIINEIKLKGTTSTDGTSSVMSGTVTYKDKEVIDYSAQTEGSDVYVKLNNVYDKAILISNDEELPQNSTDIADYKQVLSSVRVAVDKALRSAKYKKQMVSLNGSKAKKITLNMDENFVKTLVNTLLQDNKFIESYAKITAKETTEVTDELKKTIEDAKNNDEDISLYLTLKNEFRKFEYEFKSEKDLYTIEKNNNQYDYSITENDTLKYDGYIKISETNNQQFLNVSVNMIEEKVKVNVNGIYQVDKNKGPELLDTADAVKYEELSEEESNKLMAKLLESEGIKELIKDLDLENSGLLTSDM